MSASVSTVLGLSCLLFQVGAVAQQPENQKSSNTTREWKTFRDWCENRDNLNPEAKYTVEVILERIRVQDCQQAHQKLLHQTSLDLSNQSSSSQRLEDISPLASLTHLEELNLDFNRIRDINPLSSLVNLRVLYLKHGTISTRRYLIRNHTYESLDLTPIANLLNLEHLDISKNIITNLEPLDSLTNLQHLIIDCIGFCSYPSLAETHPDLAEQYNHSVDITPLSNLTNLKILHFNNNPHIQDLSPLASLKQLQVLGVSHNSIKDIRFLKDLVNLEALYLAANQFKDVSPLQNLKKMRILSMTNNRQISDITHLSSLTNLQELNLYMNQITDVTPLSSLQNLLVLNLQSNPIQDLSPLSSLTNLQALAINSGMGLSCPFHRETICVWK